MKPALIIHKSFHRLRWWLVIFSTYINLPHLSDPDPPDYQSPAPMFWQAFVYLFICLLAIFLLYPLLVSHLSIWIRIFVLADLLGLIYLSLCREPALAFSLSYVRDEFSRAQNIAGIATPHYMPSTRFDVYVRSLLHKYALEDNLVGQALTNTALQALVHTLPPGTTINRFDLRHALLTPNKDNRLLAIRLVGTLPSPSSPAHSCGLA